MEKAPENTIKKHALALAQECRYEEGHCAQVSRLAKALFDQLLLLHGLGEQEKNLLEAGALLHDIGWIKGQKKHHKTSQDIIMNSKLFPLASVERITVGLIARYHRKSLPKGSHAYYADLDKKSRSSVEILAAFLRLADGLDRSHRASVQEVSCLVSADSIIVRLYGNKVFDRDVAAGIEKSDLLEKVFARQVTIMRANDAALKEELLPRG